ncbi:MAG TPA: hypothetical protein VGV35_19095, partial [Bryobacteraceae bacterium]|nr:hypothetical protein [Bryobacteraceae bacterium]
VAAEHRESRPAETPPASSASSDPFAGHVPDRAVAAEAHVDSSEPVAAPAQVEGESAAQEIQSAAAPGQAEPGQVEAADTAAADPLPITPPEPVVAAEPALTAAAAVSSQEQDVLHKAQRFARLLVDEIKLYNLAQVSEGRKNKDLYDRLKDTIEKSRTTYQKRYGNTVAASANYFQDEMIRSLAEDDIAIMGANFRR